MLQLLYKFETTRLYKSMKCKKKTKRLQAKNIFFLNINNLYHFKFISLLFLLKQSWSLFVRSCFYPRPTLHCHVKSH